MTRNHKKRWELCRRCAEQFVELDKEIDFDVNISILKKYDLLYESDWYNILGYLAFGQKSDIVCADCEHKMEHKVLAQKI